MACKGGGDTRGILGDTRDAPNPVRHRICDVNVGEKESESISEVPPFSTCARRVSCLHCRECSRKGTKLGY
jgi:hypothetical protein